MKSKYAVVFVHGILGFDRIRLPGFSIEYFRGLSYALQNAPLPLFFPRLPAVGTVMERAGLLSGYINTIDSENLCLIGHSMGGLDARYYASKLDTGHRVKQIITVGTPHHGSPLADLIVSGKGPFPVIARHILKSGIHDLTVEACSRFNASVTDRPDIMYLSYAGARPAAEMPPWYRGWTRMINEAANGNDSQVAVTSARWGKLAGVVRADHLELAGWSLALPDRETCRPFDHIAFYRQIVKDIVEKTY